MTFSFCFSLLDARQILSAKKNQEMKRKGDPNLDSPIFNTNGGMDMPSLNLWHVPSPIGG